ncbi:hypothetical protein H0H81_011767 [Sphagnurus paluster]|uniref:NADH dehydrogenase [ubiquinone] 1 alpha subcomplex subunit n=1 Tax=Sphagnurus paluster TaxID=117069 RepID=A0A9P7FUY6_9AGAR|nr:hypothetical protein H0H81_011767 [Sphagnurus paluster]
MSRLDARRTKRTVQYKNPEDVWQYIGGGKRLPGVLRSSTYLTGLTSAVQWSSWLSHTRVQPPTLEELQTDLARQQRVLSNVAVIEARDREERAQMLRVHTKADDARKPAEAIPPPQMKRELEAQHTQASSINEHPPQPDNPLPKMPGSDAYQPEAWAPRARMRGQ